MKKISVIILALVGFTFAGCNSDKRNDQNSDSLMADTAIMDTAPADSLNNVDSALKDTGNNNVRIDSQIK